MTFEGYVMGDNGCNISLPQYSNNTIFIGEENVENVFTIKIMLRMFRLVS